MGDKKLLDTIFNNSYISTKYNIVIVDANGADRVIKKLIEYKRTHNYSNILVFIDLDDKGKHKIDVFFQKLNEKGEKKFLSSKDLYFVNPVIEYLISHWENM